VWCATRSSVTTATGPPLELQTLARFVAERDDHFRRNARVAIYCFDEAGFGSGINAMLLHPGAQAGARLLRGGGN
jgi:hypothetical protein